jgi:hypothetical protein
MTEHSFQGITPSPLRGKVSPMCPVQCVTYVSGRSLVPCNNLAIGTRRQKAENRSLKGGGFGSHVVKLDFQALLSFYRLQPRIISTKSRLFDQVTAVTFAHEQLKSAWSWTTILATVVVSR